MICSMITSVLGSTTAGYPNPSLGARQGAGLPIEDVLLEHYGYRTFWVAAVKMAYVSATSEGDHKFFF